MALSRTLHGSGVFEYERIEYGMLDLDRITFENVRLVKAVAGIPAGSVLPGLTLAVKKFQWFFSTSTNSNAWSDVSVISMAEFVAAAESI